MNKSVLTIHNLNKAVERILSGKTIRISPDRKLSIKSVEEEAGLGDGTAYYYKDFVKSLKERIVQGKASTPSDVTSIEISKLREKYRNEARLKVKYREQIKELNNKLSLLAAQNNEFSITIQQYQQRVLELESGVIHIKK